MSTETRGLLLTVAIVGALAGVLVSMAHEDSPNTDKALLFYCAAGIRPAVEPVIREYESQYGAAIQVQYGAAWELPLLI